MDLGRNDVIDANANAAAAQVIAKLRTHAETLARAEADKALGALRRFDEEQQRSVRAMADGLVERLLRAPATRLSAPGNGQLAEAAAILFGLTG